MRIEVGHHDQRVVAGGLAVAEHQGVVDGVEAQVPVRLQRRILAADAIEAGDVVAQAVGPLEVPVAAAGTFPNSRYSSPPGSRASCSISS